MDAGMDAEWAGRRVFGADWKKSALATEPEPTKPEAPEEAEPVEEPAPAELAGLLTAEQGGAQ
jgi:hypothetical protein